MVTAPVINAASNLAGTSLKGISGLPPLNVSSPSAANPINTINFAPVFGDSSASNNLPTPNSFFGGSGLLGGGGSALLFGAAAILLFAYMHHRG